MTNTMLNLPRVYISAAHKSSGKTTLSIGLCAALNQRSLKVQAFKKGPDYIDPLWLTQASGRPCHSLDFNTMSHEEIVRDFVRYGADADINIIEGNLGLYDGVALDGADSNAAVAKLTQSPVILVINSQGVTRGVAPLLIGYQSFDANIQIAGVIYNLSAGGRHEDKLRAVTEEYTDIPVLGVVKRNALLAVDERHLGLKPSNEDEGASDKIAQIASIVSDSVDIDRVLEISHAIPSLSVNDNILKPLKKDFGGLSPNIVGQGNVDKGNVDKGNVDKKLRIGICEDSAFGFYYASDKLAFESAGAELVPFSAISDEKLPDNLDAMFIGGGFPETHMEKLGRNESMRKSIYDAIESGLPSYAECGGLMYLSQSLHWNGQSEPMVGIIPADVNMHDKPQGRGYVKLEETEAMPWAKADRIHSVNNEEGKVLINAHEFHYSSVDDIKLMESKGDFAYKVHRGYGITGEYDGWVYKNLLANYSHMRDTDSFPWVSRFIAFVKACNDNNKR